MVPGAPLKGVRGPCPGSLRVSGTLSGPVVEGAGAGRLDTGYLGSEKQSEVFPIGVKGGRRCLGPGEKATRASCGAAAPWTAPPEL